MSIELRVPDIGDFDAVDVIEVLIKAGDTVEAEQSVMVLESDKASMEVPASQAGKVLEVKIGVGDKVKEGDVIALLEGVAPQAEAPAPVSESSEADVQESVAVVDLTIPDIGEDSVTVIEVSVSEGDMISKEQALITLESDKASMEVPADYAGKIIKLTVKIGDKVSTGDVIGQVQTADVAVSVAAPKKEVADLSFAAKDGAGDKSAAELKAEQKIVNEAPASNVKIDEDAFSKAYASPSVRRFARELGADLGKIKGSGRNSRITEDDVKSWVKQALSAVSSDNTAVTAGTGIPSIPAVDFSKFGEIEEQKLSRINVLTGEAMTRCWLNIPHVTQHDKCDITDLEAFRKSLKAEAEKRGVRVTMLAFLMKALTVGLKEFPRFNSSLSSDGKSLILKKYYNIGIAVDTPNGLVVPVIKDVDKKGIYELSADLMEVSKKARDGKLSPKDMSGASMTISSLGGIGGEYFTPIVNAPEVAILGVSRSAFEPVWNGKEFIPRLMLPLSLSYDHRVIDGALGARMTVFLGQMLTDMKKVLL